MKKRSENQKCKNRTTESIIITKLIALPTRTDNTAHCDPTQCLGKFNDLASCPSVLLINHYLGTHIGRGGGRGCMDPGFLDIGGK
jgi:hypothetical protein